MKANNNDNINGFGKFNRLDLDNGLIALNEEINFAQSIALGIFVKAGSRDDIKELAGLAHFTEHLAFRGTKTRTARKLALEFESLGAYTNAYTAKEYTCYYVRSLKRHFGEVFNLLADIILNPIFEESDFKKEKSIIIEEVKSLQDEAEELILDLSDAALFGENTLGCPITGTIETVKKIEISDIEKFRNKFYSANNIIIALSGDISTEEFQNLVKKHFDDKKNESLNNARITPTFAEKTENIYIKPFQQAHLLLQTPINCSSLKEKYSMAALNSLLGDGMSSRLNRTVREKEGLVYSIYSSIQHFSDCGVFSIYAGLDSSNLDFALEIIEKEFDKLVQKPPGKSELSRAKEQLKTNTIIALESVSERMQTLAKNEIEGVGFESLTQILDSIDSITAADIEELISNYLTFNKWHKTIIKQ